ncbi:exocyst subunit exo70 family protein H2 [Zostera marina]|uniref:Exocyst subunit Exo70 family protein n=1 Tax=Zostera marina TaxID=29655 RepID=A0A0K9P923_ZOSMR|nr:exocyst subunit exo70 family protein H2 [Zostera marina]
MRFSKSIWIRILLDRKLRGITSLIRRINASMYTCTDIQKAMKGLRKAFSNRCMSPAVPEHEGEAKHIKSETVTALEPIIAKWNVDKITPTSNLNHNREDIRVFIDAISQLNNHMNLAVNDATARRDLAHAHRLMQIAMKRMQKELSHILSVNRDLLDSDSIQSTVSTTITSISDSDFEESSHGVSPDEEIKYVGESTLGRVNNEAHSQAVMADLKSLAECMVTSGYTKECTNIYKNIRKSIVQEGIYRLGFHRSNQSDIQNLDWDVTVELWLAASRIAIKNIFSSERALCDYVFSTSSPHIRELCFAEITKDVAVEFLHLPELMATTKSKTPETTCRILDLYSTVSDLFPDIESVFNYDSTSTIRSQATASLNKLMKYIRTAFSDLESKVQNATSKGAVRGGGLYPLTRETMDYLVLLSEYQAALDSIFAGHPHPNLPSSPTDVEPSIPSISTRLEWLLLVLVCKLDAKAEAYKNAPLSYIYLANNYQYIVSKVRGSNLVHLLGEKWVAKHEEKILCFITGYENTAWAKVMTAIEEENINKFNSEFRDAWRKQGKWALVEEGGMRTKILASVKRKVMIPYLELCLKRTDEENRNAEESGDDVIRFLPEDLEEYMEGLFRGTILLEGNDESSSHSGLGSGSFNLSRYRSSGSGFWRS